MATLTVKAAGGGDYTTIAAALAAIGTTAGNGADDIVEVYNGVYLEGILNTLPSGTSWTHPFTLRVAAGNTATIKKTGERNIFVYEPTSLAFFSIIQGFILDGTNLSADQVAFSAAISAPSSIRMIDCEFIHTENENAIITGAFSTDIQLINLSIHGGDFFTTANAAGHNHGIYLQGSSSIVEYCHIYDCTGFGIHEYSSESPSPADNIIRYNRVHDVATESEVAAGILASSGSNTQVYKNLVYNVRGSLDDGGIGIDVAGTGTTVYNNTTYNNSWYGIFATNSTNAILRNNIAYSNGTNIHTTGASGITSSNNVTSDPTFVNVDAADFRLQPSSAAIGAGTNVSLAYFGGAPDAGAFEYFGTQQYNTTTRFYQLLLADNSVVSASTSVHCLQPVDGPNGFMTFIKAGNVAQSVARKISTGTEYINTDSTGGIGGGFNQWANDGSRYIIGARRVHHGKQFFYRDLVVFIFDTLAPGWLNFATLGRPTLDIFRGVGAGQKPLCLWVKNGRQVTGFEGSDPLGIVRRFTFITPTLIDFVLEQKTANDDINITSAFVRCQRTFNLALGGMSAIVTVATHNVNPVAPTAPDWLYNGFAA